MPFSFNQYEGVYSQFKGSTEEPLIRTALSRGYYYIFHRIKNVLGHEVGTNIRLPKQNAHKFVIDYCKEHDDESMNSLGDELVKLRDIRNQCDYDAEINNFSNVVDEFNQRLEDAKNLIQEIYP